jgi:signal transduction histidine kinase
LPNTTSISKENIKPFRLVKYFTLTSLILIFLGTIVISGLNTHWSRRMLLEKSESYARLLVDNLNHQIFLRFIIPVALKYGEIQLQDKKQFEHMDKVVRSTLHTFKVDMVHIYDRENTISYSFDTKRIGQKISGGPAYEAAFKGELTTTMVQSGKFTGIMRIFFGPPEKSKIITIAPLRAEKPLFQLSGPVLGVVEIILDVSKDFKTIFKLQILILSTCSIVMGCLFLILLFVVKRGEAIIEKRNQERIKLKEQLSRAEHLSTLGGLTAGVSHEIRNPLGIIRSSAELLKKKMDRLDTSNKIPDIIIEESTRLNNIITDFLDFAKPKEPIFSTCRVERILSKNLLSLEAQIQSEGYTVKTCFTENIPEIMADFDMLYQAFLNILINAMQAMPNGGIIHVAVQSHADKVIIFFEDEGEGIPPEALRQIWNPFFTTKEKGTGLGLGIVKNIIESHHGKIRIKNRNCGGVQVCIELPKKDTFE